MTQALCNNHFQVEWGGRRVGFMAVSGLGTSVEVVASRDGASKVNTSIALPGLQQFSPVVLTRAIEPGDNGFFEWMNATSFQQAEKRDVTVSLLNARHEPVVVWRLMAAFPSRLEYGPLHAQGNDLATETLTLVHQGMRVEHV